MEKSCELVAIFHGRVQGVFFRASIENLAKSRGIVGHVENLPNGSVKLVAQGDKKKLEEFLGHIKDHPGQAEIENVDVEYAKITCPCTEFKVKRGK